MLRISFQSKFSANSNKHYVENSARNTVLTAELCRLINLFRDDGIEAIPYKGPVLGLFAYGNIALRRFVDLDVIVKKSDVLKARDILLTQATSPPNHSHCPSRNCCSARSTTCSSHATITS